MTLFTEYSTLIVNVSWLKNATVNSEINLTESLLDVYGDSTFKAFWIFQTHF